MMAIQPVDQSELGAPRPLAQQKPKILVLLAAHNGEEWIGAQLESILAQNGVDVQIVIRDDASTDSTRSQIRAACRDASVRLICGDSPTGAAAQNYFALIRAHGAEQFDFVALSDQDDIWNPDRLARACSHLRQSQASGYSSATTAVWKNGKSALLSQGLTETVSDYLFGGIGQGCTFVMSRDFYQRARSFLAGQLELTSTLHYHDWALYALARAWNLSWTFDPEPSVQYRQHDRNDTGARSNLKGLRKRLKLIRCGWYSDQLKAIARLCARAAPANETVNQWKSLLFGKPTFRRRIGIVRFCLHGGRRRGADNATVMLSALFGWI